MAGYWPGSFFCVFTDRDGVATQNLERGKYPTILTKQAWSIKDLFYGKKTKNYFLARDST